MPADIHKLILVAGHSAGDTVQVAPGQRPSAGGDADPPLRVSNLNAVLRRPARGAHIVYERLTARRSHSPRNMQSQAPPRMSPFSNSIHTLAYGRQMSDGNR